MEPDQNFSEDNATEKKPILSGHRRYAYNYLDFRSKYQFMKPQSKSVTNTVADAAKSKCTNCSQTVSSQFWWDFAKRRLPVLDWVQYYSIRQNLLCDIIAGITVGVMHIPQGMAYAMLANVPPVIGLYVSLFPVIIYVFMGTSKHVSIGTFAVLCLMLSKSVDRFATEPDSPPSTSSLTLTLTSNQTLTLSNNTSEVIPNVAIYSSVEVAVVVCFVVGFLQIGMGIFQLGSLSVFLSDTLISGFTTGAAVHVFTSQVKNLFGVATPVRNGICKIAYTYYDLFSNIHTANYVSMIVSVITIIILIFVNEYLNPLLKSKLKIPLPIELLMIICGTLASHYIEFNSKYVVKVVGYIPTGLPYPEVPKFELIPGVLADSAAIAVVGFTIAMSMARLFAKKHKYDINANQELLAMGTGNIISSFFSCFPCCASLSRSLIQEGTGGKTQVAGLVSCIFLLVIILVVGPLFESLPNCILSSIIVVALKGMFKQFNDLREIWKVSKLDSLIWINTFLGVVITDVDIGLAIGIGTSMLIVVIRAQRPYTCLLGQVPETDIYLDVSKYKKAKEEMGVKYFRFSSSLYCANREYFLHELYRSVGHNPHSLLSRRAKLKAMKEYEHDWQRQREMKWASSTEGRRMTDLDNKSGSQIVPVSAHILITSENGIPDQQRLSVDNESPTITQPLPMKANNNMEDDSYNMMEIQHIVIDCSLWGYIDNAGINTLIQVITEYQELGIDVHLASCPDTMVETLEKHPSYKEYFERRLFPTIPDAKAFIFHLGFNTGANVCH